MGKYVKLDHVQELLKLIKARDCFMDWTNEYEKLDKKVKTTIDWLERNAKEINNTELTVKGTFMGKDEFAKFGEKNDSK